MRTPAGSGPTGALKERAMRKHRKLRLRIIVILILRVKVSR
jgi:hypothetical protein